jgi:hypothetical protein
MFLLNAANSYLPVHEYTKLRLPIIGALDTESDHRRIAYPIPMNDDSLIANTFICHLISKAFLEGKMNKFLVSKNQLKTQLKKKIENVWFSLLLEKFKDPSSSPAFLLSSIYNMSKYQKQMNALYSKHEFVEANHLFTNRMNRFYVQRKKERREKRKMSSKSKSRMNYKKDPKKRVFN